MSGGRGRVGRNNVAGKPGQVPHHTHSILDLPTGTGPGQLALADATASVVLKKRLQLAELPAALSYVALFGMIPANRVVQAVFLYVTDAPLGGGVSSLLAGISPAAPAGTLYLEGAQLFGFGSPAYYTRYNGIPAAFELPVPDAHEVDRQVGVAVTADVNLDTLTNLDLTAFVVLSPVVLIVP